MKNICILAIMLITAVSFAQNERSLELNKATDLIDVVYYHDNGEVSQTGSYTKDGKLHGEWLSFSEQGTKIVSAKYNNGKKVGKWFYWNGNSLTEVDYSNNEIASVNQWTSTESLASSN
ncbi:nicotinic acid mononucleotide adenyltransferase [uncultured Psychroserpens sp.]|uniref:toxin-antitoxin system YwqK family antitoxin n=1 Tax=uncultured Psychroserpens sp. TaxID=255436 RepID=UPI00262E75DA|nr:nicotinic acid mononucleotide adenyltransferase [uncultured Psychroserpens sp.]